MNLQTHLTYNLALKTDKSIYYRSCQLEGIYVKNGVLKVRIRHQNGIAYFQATELTNAWVATIELKDTVSFSDSDTPEEEKPTKRSYYDRERDLW